MTTAEAVDKINENYNRNILLFIFIATIAVGVFITILIFLFNISPTWYLLPASWWVGGMMVWAHSAIFGR